MIRSLSLSLAYDVLFDNWASHFQLVEKMNHTICSGVTCVHQGRTHDDYNYISPVPVPTLRLQSVVRVLFAGIGPLLPELPPSLRPSVRQSSRSSSGLLQDSVVCSGRQL
jgi:hypothetical protein